MRTDVLLLAAAVAYGVVAVRLWSRSRTLQDRGTRLLAGVSAALGVGALLSIPAGDPGTSGLVALVGLVWACGLYLWGLLGFASTLQPVRPSARTAVLALTALSGAALGWLTAARGMVDVAVAIASLVLVGTFVAAWGLVHVVVALVLRRTFRDSRAALARSRGRAMLVAVVALALTLPSGLLLPSLGLEQDLALVIALGAVLALRLGYLPPEPVRWWWQRRDLVEIGAAERRLLVAADPVEEMRDRTLPDLVVLLDAAGAWVTDGGRIVASSGVLPGSDVQVAAAEDRRDAAVVEDGWVLSAPTGTGLLHVFTRRDPLLAGDIENDVIDHLALEAGVALERARAADQQLKQAAALTAAEHRAEVAELKDDVLSTLSHELRTPLVTISGMSELLDVRWEAVADDQRRQMVGRIRANAAEMRGLVEATLELAMLRASGGTAQLVPVDLATALSDLPAGAGVAVDVDLPARTRVCANDDLLHATVTELVTNAVKFGAERVRVGVERDRGAVLLHVDDDGPGLPPEELEAVFEPFRRGGHVLTRETRGLGLGLTLARLRAVRMGAQLTLTSPGPAGGCRATLRLVAADDVG